jgi:hypothetical protein
MIACRWLTDPGNEPKTMAALTGGIADALNHVDLTVREKTHNQFKL